MSKNPLCLKPLPVSFGTDGWRGVLGVDFTLERLIPVAIASAQELCYRAPENLETRKVIIGYDRRFLASAMAEAIADAVRGCNLEPCLANEPVTTPACSWAVVQQKALGALVITASHNPPQWLGLKIKGSWGGSVEEDFTKAVERRLEAGGITTPIEGLTHRFDCRNDHLNFLKTKFDIPKIIGSLKSLGINVLVDSMHGSASGCIRDLTGEEGIGLIKEIHVNPDPLFGGNPPEPLEKYIPQLIEEVKLSKEEGKFALGLVFDGDGDRIAAVDENGRYCSTQLLMPLLIDHLARVKQSSGCIIKTVSGCDLMRLVAENYGREVLELPVGFKYIAKEMLSRDVLVGGEESGGVGFGSHIPERDALFTALVLLEAIAESKLPLGKRLDSLAESFGDIYFDRLDLSLKNVEDKERIETFLRNQTPTAVLEKDVKEVITIDGIKLRIDKNYWLMFRFSGTEPLLRIYCEAPSHDEVRETLTWANQLINDQLFV